MSHSTKTSILRARCNAEMKRKLHQCAKRRGEPAAVLIREALLLYFIRERRQAMLEGDANPETMELLSEALDKGLEQMISEKKRGKAKRSKE